jgi:hypothetical protein
VSRHDFIFVISERSELTVEFWLFLENEKTRRVSLGLLAERAEAVE